MATYEGTCPEHGKVSQLFDLSCSELITVCPLDRCSEQVTWKLKRRLEMTENNPLLVDPKKPVYDGYCPDHGQVYSNHQEPGPPYGCTGDRCRETIEWKKQKETNLHYLILRYNSGLVEVFKGEDQQMVLLFDQFRDACFREPRPNKIRIGRRLILDISELHSVQMVDNKADADALSANPYDNKNCPYIYPELKEEKKETGDPK